MGLLIVQRVRGRGRRGMKNWLISGGSQGRGWKPTRGPRSGSGRRRNSGARGLGGCSVFAPASDRDLSHVQRARRYERAQGGLKHFFFFFFFGTIVMHVVHKENKVAERGERLRHNWG